MRPKHGMIVWWDDCPPLDGDDEKRRPVIVVNPNLGSEFLYVMPTSCTAGPRERDAIPLPTQQDHQCTTGLPRPCCAIPRWFLKMPHTVFAECDYCGYLTGRKLQEVLAAFIARYKPGATDGAGLDLR
jgi:mRNA-degrading endonuclease toxin of MazEF toxin-antitoxin module